MFSRQKSGDNFYLQKYTNYQEQNNNLQQSQYNKYHHQASSSEISNNFTINQPSNFNGGMNKLSNLTSQPNRKSQQQNGTAPQAQTQYDLKQPTVKSQNELGVIDNDSQVCQTAPSLVEINIAYVKNPGEDGGINLGSQFSGMNDINGGQQNANSFVGMMTSNSGSKTQLGYQNLKKPKNNYFFKQYEQQQQQQQNLQQQSKQQSYQLLQPQQQQQQQLQKQNIQSSNIISQNQLNNGSPSAALLNLQKDNKSPKSTISGFGIKGNNSSNPYGQINKQNKDKQIGSNYQSQNNISNFKQLKRDTSPQKLQQPLYLQNNQYSEDPMKNPQNNKILLGPYTSVDSPQQVQSQKLLYQKQNSLGDSQNKFSASQFSHQLPAAGQTQSFIMNSSQTQNNNTNSKTVNGIQLQYTPLTSSTGQISSSCTNLSKSINKPSSTYDQYLIKQNEQKITSKNSFESISGLSSNVISKSKQHGVSVKRTNHTLFNINTTSQDFNNAQQLYFQEKVQPSGQNQNNSSMQKSSHHRRQNSYQHNNSNNNNNNNCGGDNEEALEDYSISSHQPLNVSSIAGVKSDMRVSSSSNNSYQVIQYPESLINNSNNKTNNTSMNNQVSTSNNLTQSSHSKLSPSKTTSIRESSKKEELNITNNNLIGQQKSLLTKISQEKPITQFYPNNKQQKQSVHNNDLKSEQLNYQQQQIQSDQLNIKNQDSKHLLPQEETAEKDSKSQNNQDDYHYNIEVNRAQDNDQIHKMTGDIINSTSQGQLNSLQPNQYLQQRNEQYLQPQDNQYYTQQQYINDQGINNKQHVKTNYSTYMLNHLTSQIAKGQVESNFIGSKTATPSPQVDSFVQRIQKNIFFTKQNSINLYEENNLSADECDKRSTQTLVNNSNKGSNHQLEKPSQFKEKKKEQTDSMYFTSHKKPLSCILSSEIQQHTNLINYQNNTNQQPSINILNIPEQYTQGDSKLNSLGYVQSNPQLNQFSSNSILEQPLSQQKYEEAIQGDYFSQVQQQLQKNNESYKNSAQSSLKHIDLPQKIQYNNPLSLEQNLQIDNQRNNTDQQLKQTSQNQNLNSDFLQKQETNNLITPQKSQFNGNNQGQNSQKCQSLNISTQNQDNSQEIIQPKQANLQQFQISHTAHKSQQQNISLLKPQTIQNKKVSLQDERIDQSSIPQDQNSSFKQNQQQNSGVSQNIDNFEIKDDEYCYMSSLGEQFKMRNKIHEKAINRVNITLKQNKKASKKNRDEASQDESGSDSSFSELNSQRNTNLSQNQINNTSSNKSQNKISSSDNLDQYQSHQSYLINPRQSPSTSQKLIEDESKTEQNRKIEGIDSTQKNYQNKGSFDSAGMNKFLNEDKRKSPMKNVASANKSITKNQYLLYQNISNQSKKVDRNGSSKIAYQNGNQNIINDDKYQSPLTINSSLNGMESTKLQTSTTTTTTHNKNMIPVTQDKQIDIEDPNVQKEFSQIVRNLLKLKNDTSRLHNLLSKNEIKSMNSSLNANIAQKNSNNNNNRPSAHTTTNQSQNTQNKHEYLFEKLYMEIVNKFDHKDNVGGSNTTSTNNSSTAPSQPLINYANNINNNNNHNNFISSSSQSSFNQLSNLSSNKPNQN